MSLLFGVLTQFFLSNQVATGLALTLFGLGLSALLGQGYIGIKGVEVNDLNLGPLADIPVIGPILFQHDAMVYISLLIVAGVWATLNDIPIPARLPSAAEKVLRALEWRHSQGRHPPAHWFTTLADPPRDGPLRDDVRRLAEATLRP